MVKKRSYPGSLSEQAYIRIRNKILNGEFPLGAALSRRNLASEFRMSFLPITEAIKRLEEESLVESLPRVGTRVRIPSAQDLRDRCVLREALEAQSARLFAEKASSDERMELRTMAARLDTLAAECPPGDTDRESRFRVQMYHHSFHMRIAECTGCAALCDALEKNQVLVFNWLYDVAADHQMPPRWHQQLIEAIAGADPEAADAAMRRHVRHSLEEIQAEIASHFGVHQSPLFISPRTPHSPASGIGAWRVKAGSRR